MRKSKIYTRSWRVRKAYWTTFVVMSRYIRLYLLSRLLGKRYYQNRIVDLHLKNAQLVKKNILQLEGLFIKVGQLLSILTNFLPEAFQEPLEALQDQIPPRPYAEIQERIKKEFGINPSELFEHFEKEPIASASIGQAHKARLKDGTEVVVKVQHANIEKVAAIDLEIMQRLTKLVGWFMEIKGMEYAYTQVRKMIEEELDFAQEAQSMQRIRNNLSDLEGFIIPEVHRDYSTQRVLTTSFYEGVKISNVSQIQSWDLNRKELAERLVNAYCKMVFTDGFYHADPHPGNILVQSDGTMVLLDFGAVASLQTSMRDGLLNLIEGAAKNDLDKIVQALGKMGFIAHERESERMAEKIIDAFRNFLQNEVQFDGLNFKDIKVNPFQTSLFNLISEIGLKDIGNTVMVPKDYVLLNRMLTLLLGICNTLDHRMNPLEVVQPYFKSYILGERSDLVKYVSNLLQQTLTNAISLPGDLRKLVKTVQRGEVELRYSGHNQMLRLQYYQGQQLIISLLLIASIAFGYYHQIHLQKTWPNYLFWITGGMSFLLLRSFWMARKMLKRL